MYGVLALEKDPFDSSLLSPLSMDESLHWTSGGRQSAEQEALKALREGKSVWISGEPGSGKSHFLCRVLSVLAKEGRTVFAPEIGDAETSGSPVVSLAELRKNPADDEGDSTVPALQNILDAFQRGGTVIFAPSTSLASARTLEESLELMKLRLAGQPLIAFALLGESEAPMAEAVSIQIPKFDKNELKNCLQHRLEACGGAGLVNSKTLDEIASAAAGVGRAIRLARDELSRRAFFAALESKEESSNLSSDAEEASGIFDREQVDEAANLMEGL